MSPLFPPREDREDEEAAREEVRETVQDSPRDTKSGSDRSRWSLTLLREHLAERDWTVSTDGGMSKILSRLGFSYKIGRLQMQSPDPDYEAKRDRLEARRTQVQQESESVLLYQDEVTYYGTPSLERSHGPVGSEQPQAPSPTDRTNKARIAAVMEPETGRVEYLHRTGKLGRKALLSLYEQVVAAWPDSTIYMVQDNWPVHFHPEVMEQLASQQSSWAFETPNNWPDNGDAVAQDGALPIQIVRLPTYAPWLNPIEKLWRWLKQERIHLHTFEDDWEGLQEAVCDFLDALQDGSEELRRYAGLLPS